MEYRYPYWILVFIGVIWISTTLADEILFSDDFSNSSSGWKTFSNETGKAYYKDGELHIVDTTESDSTSDSCYPGEFSDFILDYDTKWIDGAENNWNIVKCRYSGDDNNYGFGISADGYFCVLKYVNGEKTHFVGPVESKYVNKGLNAVNHCRIDCREDNLRFMVNGHILGEFSDSSHEKGGICLACKAIEGEFTEITFDNLVVQKPI